MPISGRYNRNKFLKGTFGQYTRTLIRTFHLHLTYLTDHNKNVNIRWDNFVCVSALYVWGCLCIDSTNWSWFIYIWMEVSLVHLSPALMCNNSAHNYLKSLVDFRYFWRLSIYLSRPRLIDLIRIIFHLFASPKESFPVYCHKREHYFGGAKH